MKTRKLVIVVLVVAVVGFLTYTYLFRTNHDEDSASMATSTISARSTAAPAAPPVDVATELQTASRAAEQAARQGLTVAFTWYPATDITQNDAYGRARNWLTAKLADRMIVDARTERGPGVQW
ncbi:hypothetical protein ACFVW2_36835, partial [Streptomyces sp. NPDC058171]